MSKVSIVMPLYNAEKYVSKAIESILEQTYQDFELVIVNDASTDNSRQIVEKYKDKRIRVIDNTRNIGIAGTRNKGIELSKAEYIALLDDDDIAMPYRLEHEVKFLDEHKDIMVVGGHHREIDEKGKDLEKKWLVYQNPNYIKAFLMLNNAVVNGSTMFRKSFVTKHNIAYRNDMCGAEDYLFWVECSLKGKIKNLDEVLLLWRRTENQQTTKILVKQIEKRNQVLDYIRHVAFEGNGYMLNAEDYAIINKVFAEEAGIDSEEEINKIYWTLKKITEQAKENDVDNKNEVIAMCRKRFGEKIGKAFFLWV